MGRKLTLRQFATLAVHPAFDESDPTRLDLNSATRLRPNQGRHRMTTDDTFRNFFSDVWSEIEHIIDTEDLTDRDFVKLRILGSIQSKAEIFGVRRNALGIPIEDADTLFINRLARG